MRTISICFLLYISASAWADKLEYFESKIDFWGDKPKSNTAPLVESEKSSNEKFPWKTFLDPKNKEFFKEGDYTPPEPFMEVARNPTDENIEQWFELMQKKNDLQTKLQVRMQEYMVKNGSAHAPETVMSQKQSLPNNSLQATTLDPKRFKIRMYFESTCPHCRRMFGVLKRLQDSGIEIEALQIDSGPVPSDEKVVPIARADPNDLKKHGISGVPFVLVADKKRQALLPKIEGYHDFDEIIRLLKAASRI